MVTDISTPGKLHWVIIYSIAYLNNLYSFRSEAESSSGTIPSEGADTVILRELKRIFELADLKNTGFVHYEEFETILHELSKFKVLCIFVSTYIV